VGKVVSELLVLLGIILAGASGVPGLFLSRHTTRGQSLATALAGLGAALSLAGIAVFWAGGDSRALVLPWPLPGAEFSVALDGLSAVFLVPICLISILGQIYGLRYCKPTDHVETGVKLRFFYGVLTAGMALLVIAKNGILFLFGWEIMALAAFFLVATEDRKKEVCATAWIYLVATHTATLCLFALFGILHAANGSFALTPLAPDNLTPGMKTAVFVLALIGFGLKAGVMPLHVWLPGAHAMAPSHVSAIMSGVIIKMGIYGLARVLSLMPDPPLAWGCTVLGLGVVSGVFGVVFAIAQHDLKRLLAYHSIENIGIIVMGLGLALIGRTLQRPDWVALGLSGALLHVWNHALFKALLFLSAGSVIHGTHTREIDRLGGLAKKMPWTALAFLVGAVAICGLPPLNGFVSEFLIYLGLFRTLHAQEPYLAGVALAAPALALIGALALACFVKVYGAVFLGSARSQASRETHEAPASMILPMGVLAGCCLAIGLVPGLILPLFEQAIADWSPGMASVTPAALAPLGWMTTMGVLLALALLLGAALLRHWPGQSKIRHTATWGCAYNAPTPRMQYTSSSFAQLLVGLFAWALRPRLHKPGGLPLFPLRRDFHSDVPKTVLDEAVLPAFRFGSWLFSWLRVFQRGNIQAYLLYVFVALIILLLWR
jgi:hydrogenase-4 component B